MNLIEDLSSVTVKFHLEHSKDEKSLPSQIGGLKLFVRTMPERILKMLPGSETMSNKQNVVLHVTVTNKLRETYGPRSIIVSLEQLRKGYNCLNNDELKEKFPEAFKSIDLIAKKEVLKDLEELTRGYPKDEKGQIKKELMIKIIKACHKSHVFDEDSAKKAA